MKNKNDIIWLDSTDSTNNEVKRRIGSLDNLSVVSALSQTEGRGHAGNSWVSNKGENLTFSIILKHLEQGLELKGGEQFIISQISSISVVEYLQECGIEAKIKWPNDIYVGDRKVCGILIEHSLRGDEISRSIIGIGLNINQRNFNVNLPNPTSMVLCRAEDGPLDIHRCLEEFMDIFTSLHDRFLSSAYDLSPLRQRYLSSLWRFGEPSRFIDYTFLPGGHLDGPMNICTGKVHDTGIPSSDQTGNEFPGIIRGLSPTGNLLVEDLSTGLTHEFGFKEIGYIL